MPEPAGAAQRAADAAIERAELAAGERIDGWLARRVPAYARWRSRRIARLMARCLIARLMARWEAARPDVLD